MAIKEVLLFKLGEVSMASFINYRCRGIGVLKTTPIYYFVLQVLKEMKSNETLAPFLTEYTRLFESLYRTHKMEKELSEKCELLQVILKIFVYFE